MYLQARDSGIVEASSGLMGGVGPMGASMDLMGGISTVGASAGLMGGVCPSAHPGHSFWVRVLGIPLLVWATRHLGWGPLMSPTLQVWLCRFLGPLKLALAFGSFTANKS